MSASSLQYYLPSREPILEKLENEQFDLLVIGGGITGAGIALDAVSRGMKVALLEKGDFASGTSSRSTKLIHGGLRYLKQFDFWLVKEVGSERSVVHKLAPHLVVPEKMLLPLIENGTYGKWLTSVGLKIYDILAQVGGPDRRQMLEKEEALSKEPLLPEKVLKGAGYYAEYRTDDARLTIEILKTAAEQGGTLINYTRVTDFTYDAGKVSGVHCKELEHGRELQVKAKAVVNATGPWVDELRHVNNSAQGKQLYLTKGVHLVFPHEKLPVKQAIYFDVPDGRMIFAIPRGRTTYVGTTDTPFDKDKDNPKTDLADAMYLISAVNNMFPSIELGLEDIESSWAGLRPLIFEEGKSASELSRKDEIFISDTGLISIAGGKLTGYRKMAERVVDRVVKAREEEGMETGPCVTDKIILKGGDFSSYSKVISYRKQILEQSAELGLQRKHVEYLVATYGRQTEVILEEFKLIAQGTVDEKLLLSELAFSLKQEFVRTPADFLVRRTGRMYFDLPSVRHHMEAVLQVFQEKCGVDEALVKFWREQLQAMLKEHSDFSLDRDRVSSASH